MVAASSRCADFSFNGIEKKAEAHGNFARLIVSLREREKKLDGKDQNLSENNVKIRQTMQQHFTYHIEHYSPTAQCPHQGTVKMMIARQIPIPFITVKSTIIRFYYHDSFQHRSSRLRLSFFLLLALISINSFSIFGIFSCARSFILCHECVRACGCLCGAHFITEADIWIYIMILELLWDDEKRDSAGR